MSGFTTTHFNSENNTNNNVTLFAPTTVTVNASDISLALMGVSTSGDYLVDCCLTLDVSWARAALRWANNDADTRDFYPNANASFGEAVRDVLEGAINTTVKKSTASEYYETMGTSAEENLAGHVLGYATHAILGDADLRHILLNAQAFMDDVSATKIGASFNTNLTDASDGQVMLETLNNYDYNGGTPRNRFDALSELDLMDNSYNSSPFPLLADDRILIKVRVQGDGTGDVIDHAVQPVLGTLSSANTDATTISNPGTGSVNPAEWLVRITLKANADSNVKATTYSFPDGNHDES